MSSLKFENLWKLMIDHNFLNYGDIPDGVLCLICEKLLIEPYTSSCGCQYCNICIREHLRENNIFCPGYKAICKEEILEMEKNLVKDFRARQNILKVNVTCSNVLCSFVSNLEDIGEHIRICTNRSISCPYETMGCMNEGIKEDGMTDHLYLNWLAHSQLLVEAVNHLRNDVDGLRREVTAKDEELNKMKEERTIDVKEINDLRMEMIKLNEDREHDRINLEKQSRLLKEYIVQGQQHEGNKNILAERMVDITTVRKVTGGEIKNDSITPDEATSPKFPMKVKRKEEIEGIDVNIRMRELNVIHDFMWNINSFSELVEGTVNSNPFYKDNYKLCLRIQVGRFDVCLSFCIMRGEMDAHAKWPMRHTVILHVINQETMQAYTSDKYHLDTHKGNKAVFGRPKNFTGAVLGGRWISLNDIHNVRGLLLRDSLMVCCSMLAL